MIYKNKNCEKKPTKYLQIKINQKEKNTHIHTRVHEGTQPQQQTAEETRKSNQDVKSIYLAKNLV